MRGKKIIILCVLFLLVTVVIFTQSYQNDYRAANEKAAAAFPAHWHYTVPASGETGETTLPGKIAMGNDTVVLENQIPAGTEDGAALLLYTKQQRIRVYLDGALLYAYPSSEQNIFRSSVPNAWHIIPLPANQQGGALRVELTSPILLYGGYLPAILLGEKAAQVFELFRLYGWDLLFALLVIASGIIILGSYLLNKSIQLKYENIIYLGLFTLFMGFFFLFGTPLTLLALPDPYLLSFLAMAMLFFLPVPLLIFLNKTYQPRKKRFLSLCTAAATVIFMASCLSQVLRWADWIHLLPLYIFTLLIYFIIIGYISACEARDGNPHMRQFFFFFTIFLIGILLDLGRLGLEIYAGSAFSFSQWPALLFTKIAFALSLAVLLFKTSAFFSDSYNQIKRSEVLTLLAYTDLLTGVQNEKSFNAELERRKKARRKKAFTIFMLDIDQLEDANAGHGAAFGDAVLKSTGELILTAFGKDDLAYRLGGDEFYILSPDIHPTIIANKCRAFEEKLANHNLSGAFQVSITLVHHICRPRTAADIDNARVAVEEKLTAYKREKKAKD